MHLFNNFMLFCVIVFVLWIILFCYCRCCFVVIRCATMVYMCDFFTVLSDNTMQTRNLVRASCHAFTSSLCVVLCDYICCLNNFMIVVVVVVLS